MQNSSPNSKLNSQGNIVIFEEAALVNLANEVAPHINKGDVIYLQGSLGAGKTAFTRAILRHFGWSSAVPSPTFSLLETYSFSDKIIYHLDLYRLATSSDLYNLGLDDYLLDSNAIFFIEWADKFESGLPPPTLVITLSSLEDNDNLDGRIIFWKLQNNYSKALHGTLSYASKNYR